ncbi:MAG: response regulator transcription factor [Bdellovibrionales bacterium]
MSRVLFLEDSKECQAIVRKALENSRVELTIAETVAEARRLIENYYFDMALIDFLLPEGSGYDVFHELRQRSDIPIFFFTSHDGIEAKVAAFENGADDYIVKPIEPVELRARILMRLRKSKDPHLSPILRRGDLHIDTASMTAYMKVNNQPRDLELTSKELKILAQLMRQEGRVQSRADLVRTIWGDNVHVLSRTIDSHVCSLRKKMDIYGPCIESIPKVGYRFSLELIEKDSQSQLEPELKKA